MPTSFRADLQGPQAGQRAGRGAVRRAAGRQGHQGRYLRSWAATAPTRCTYCESPLLDVYTTDAYTKVICDVIEDLKPEAFLIGATNIGRDLGPRCAARLHTGLCADCTHLDVDVANYKSSSW